MASGVGCGVAAELARSCCGGSSRLIAVRSIGAVMVAWVGPRREAWRGYRIVIGGSRGLGVEAEIHAGMHDAARDRDGGKNCHA